MQKKKYGIWKTRYAILFSTELGALEYMHSMEMRTQSVFTEFEVREVS